jgi:hypothetical protein
LGSLGDALTIPCWILRTRCIHRSTVHAALGLDAALCAVRAYARASSGYVFLWNFDSDVGNRRATPPAPFFLPTRTGHPLRFPRKWRATSSPLRSWPPSPLHYSSPRFRTISAQPRASPQLSTTSTNRIPHGARAAIARRRGDLAFFCKEGFDAMTEC